MLDFPTLQPTLMFTVKKKKKNLLSNSEMIRDSLSPLCMCVCLSAGPPYGNIHWGLPALHAEHSGGDSLSASHLDCRHSRNSRIFRHCLHVLHLRE